MYDTYGDGWHGNAFGIKQNDDIVSTFGSNFTSGSSYGPVLLNVIPNVHASLILVSSGLNKHQIKFYLYDENGELIYYKSPSSFSSDTIFH